MKEQSDEWLLRFYTFFGKRPRIIDKLKTKPIIRLENGEHIIPFKQDDSPNVYLPPENDTEFPVVFRIISEPKNEKALEFLRKLGLREPDAVAEVMEYVLRKYEKTETNISSDEHIKDMKKILHAYSTDSQKEKSLLVKKLQNTAFIRAENPVLEQIEYKKPRELYFRNKELIIYFEGNKDAWFISSEYDESFGDLFKNLGVHNKVEIKRKMPNWDLYVIIRDFRGWHERGLNGFDPKIEVVGLKYAIKHPTLEKSRFIWNRIAIKNSDCIRGVIESSSRQSYENSHKKELISEGFGQLLIDNPWLPDKEGNFHKPEELKLGDLPELFIRDEKLANQLGMNKDVVAKLAEEIGIESEDIDFIKQIKEDPEKYKEFQAFKVNLERKEKPTFPTGTSTNPDRRKERIVAQINDALDKKYEQKNISVKITANTIDEKTYLRNTYTNDAGQMICQICKKEMPFKKRNGEYYFEAVEALSIDYFPKEHEAQYLALCPVCAAMYKEFVKDDKGAMESFKNALINSEKAEVPLQLGELKTSIRFVDSHFLDIKTIIKEQDESRKE